jgi:hypothetical protein
LAVQVDPATGNTNLNIRVPLCPTGDSISLSNRHIHFQAMVQTAPGSPTTLDPINDHAYANPNAWNGTQFSYSPDEQISLTPEGGWVAFDFTVPSSDPGAMTLTHFGIALTVQRAQSSTTWSGTFYVDDIQLQ